MAFVSTVINVLLIILGFGVLIFVHELGHFIAAKWAGIRTEAFAIGMGPVVLSWRKGIGLRFGSTARDYQARVKQFLATDGAHQLKSRNDTEGEPELTQEAIYRVGDKLGLGETEYSLRWLPIGGFVKMLGQEDANPNYVSDDPRSYNRCPIGKRMIVVSAGVLMNLLLAVIIFIVAFMIGVKFEAPVVGDVYPDLPAGITMADNAAAMGITEPGLQPGDVVLTIDGHPAETFADLQIASAMSKPGVPVRITVRRADVSEPLVFTMMPRKDSITGLLSLGIAPGSSAQLRSRDEDGVLTRMLEEGGLAQSGVRPGMTMVRAAGRDISTFQQLQQIVGDSEGKPIETAWMSADSKSAPKGSSVNASLNVEPEYQVLQYAGEAADAVRFYEDGLFGLSPLVRVAEVIAGSANQNILKAGDVILSVGGVDGPRFADFLEIIQKHEPGKIAMTVLRDGRELHLDAIVQRRGLFKSAGALNIRLDQAWETPITAQPMEQMSTVEVVQSPDGSSKSTMKDVSTPVAPLHLVGRTRIDLIGGAPVSDWRDIREQLREKTDQAHQAGEGAAVAMTFSFATPGQQPQTVTLELNSDDVKSLHGLGWRSPLPSIAFEPVYTVRDADGNPLKAIAMGFEETKKLVMMTYLTIDRLIRGSVGVEQLRGPVGIVHIGTKVADKGLLYSLFFLGMISVNLAVINFLPLPIVDGGLFLFLIYEKLKGRPPSIAFQNVATIVGLCIIGALFLVTFYNDVLRLFS